MIKDYFIQKEKINKKDNKIPTRAALKKWYPKFLSPLFNPKKLTIAEATKKYNTPKTIEKIVAVKIDVINFNKNVNILYL